MNRPEFLGIHSINPFNKHNSPARLVMFGQHFAARLVFNGLEERTTTSGVDGKLSEGTVGVRMPEDGTILQIIDRYPAHFFDKPILNPEKLVIYEDAKTHEVGCFSIVNYGQTHPEFGFDFQEGPDYYRLTPGAKIDKDALFLKSPGVTENGGYAYGINLPTAFMSCPGVAEDGIIVADEALDLLKFKMYLKFRIDFGKNEFPINLFGDESNYKPTFDIGEETDEKSPLLVLRRYDPLLAPVTQSHRDVREVDWTFDIKTYGLQQKGKVVDLKVYHTFKDGEGFRAQTEFFDRYARALNNYYETLLMMETRLRREYHSIHGTDLPLKPELIRLLTHARSVLNKQHPDSRSLFLEYRKAPLDDYHVELVVEYEIRPDIGFKLTDTSGGQPV